MKPKKMKARIYNFLFWIDKVDARELKKRFTTILRQSKFRIKGFIGVPFKPQGYTAVWVLAESHLAIHTFPEEGVTRCELSSCNYRKYLEFKRLVRGLGKKGKRKIQGINIIELSLWQHL